MGILQKLFRREPKSTSYAEMLSGYAPIFSQFGQNIYASDVVQQAISCVVTEMKKLKLMHVREVGADVVPVPGSLQRILNEPNEHMTQADFLEKVFSILLMNLNAFIIPTYYTWADGGGTEHRVYTGLYPILPTQVDFLEDGAGVLFVKFRFANGYETTLRYSDVIHLKLRYGVNDFMGGDETGQADHSALLKTLELNNTMLNGISSAMKASFAVNGVVKYNALMDDGKTEKSIKELEKKLRNSESGFLPLDLKSEFTPIHREVHLVDTDTLKFVDEKILRHFGVSLPILTGEYTKEEYEAFYQKTLEPLIVILSQGFTKALFTDGEKSHRNKIRLYPKDLIFMSVAQTLEMVRLLGDSGALYENEKRVAFGLQPLEELAGKRMQSLNYVDVTLAKEYQQGGKKNEPNTT